MIEAAKFVVTGVTNTTVDFVVLNLLIVLFGITEGDPKYVVFKALSYLVASTNSFILNKWWVFKNEKKTGTREVGSFAVINGVGLILNTLISLLVFRAGTELFPAFSPHAWANIGALSGTVVVFLFNFLSYKLIVFKK